MQAQTYLFFDGRCDEALDFYKQKLGAKVDMLMHYKDAPPDAKSGMPPASNDKVMHASFRIGDTQLMASDGHCEGKPKFEGFALSLTPPNEAEAGKLFDALADGGQVRVPLAKTFFSPSFGIVADRFGVGWMIMVPQQH